MKSGNNIPRATYRLQFHRHFTLRDALALVPYLDELGISHLYASPLLKACAGSTHGYDVCDCSRLNPEIGTEADLANLVAALQARGMGLVLDIVPNHMAASSENPWWWDVLMRGRASHFANHFDIDWDAPDPRLKGKVLLPVLGDELERVLERGELKVVCENAEVTLRYFDHRFPVHPESILVPHKFLEEAIHDFNANPSALKKFLDQQHYRLTFWRHGDSQINYRRFFNITSLAGVRVELPQVFADTHNRILDWHQRGWIDGLRIDHPDGLHDPKEYLERLHRAAPGAWIVVEKILEPGEKLPADWPVAGTTGYDFLNRLGGLFIDFSAAKTLTDFYSEFTGEPTDYAAMVFTKKRWGLEHLLRAELDRLVRLLSEIARLHAPEKIISQEDLRSALSALIACLPVYRTYIQAGNTNPSEQDKQWLREAMAQALSLDARPQPALLAFLLDLLQKKNTGDQHALSKPGRRRGNESQTETNLETPLVVSYSLEKGDLETDFVMRFQQLTGPAMAKGVEDTSFYCFNRFVALNEVGGDPGHFGMSVESFHQSCAEAREHWPDAMLASSTHDTKRSEDVRARLALLAEIPAEWTAAVCRWSAMNEKHRRHLDESDGLAANERPARSAELHSAVSQVCNLRGDSSTRTASETSDDLPNAIRRYGRLQICATTPGRPSHEPTGDFPDRNAEYLFYQTLVGAWPLSVDRAVAYLEKASREAKQHTNWTEPNAAYDEALKQFVTATMTDVAFMADVERFVTPLVAAGQINSLAQTLIKLTAPGVPDIYQGTELWDLSLVDPDNRRPVDFALRREAMESLTREIKKEPTPDFARELCRHSDDGRVKLFVIRSALNFRRTHPELFQRGDYAPLSVSGDQREHICSFSRTFEASVAADMRRPQRVIVVVPRLVCSRTRGPNWLLGEAAWGSTRLLLGNSPAAAYRNIFTGELLSPDEIGPEPGLTLSRVFANFPVAMLEAAH